MSWVWAERTGTAAYRGRNARGAAVDMAREDTWGVFTPGELLGIALAGCIGLSADAPIARRLGGDADLRIDIDRVKHDVEDRYAELSAQITAAIDTLEPAERVRLVEVVERAIDRTCTVGNTLTAGAEVAHYIHSGEADAVDDTDDATGTVAP